jgi:hypothetical protein
LNIGGIGKDLVSAIMVKNVPGFCTEVKEAMKMLNVAEDDQLLKQDGKKIRKEVKVRLMKRILEIPYSTPSSIVKYEFGITDMGLDCHLEKIVLSCNTLNIGGIGKDLVSAIMVKNVPGFCTEVKEAMKMLNVAEDDQLLKQDGKKIRKELKKKVINLQKEKLVEKMLGESKCDRVLMHNFEFNGKVKRYLVELKFEEARAIFLLRSRMFPTKKNFQGRWGVDDTCTFCHEEENDVHLFACAGFSDLLENIKYEDCMSLEVSMEKLSDYAKKLIRVKERLETINIV